MTSPWPWNKLISLFAVLPLSLFYSSCTTGGGPTGSGPFDRSGNYVEAWATPPTSLEDETNTGITISPRSTPVQQPKSPQTKRPQMQQP